MKQILVLAMAIAFALAIAGTAIGPGGDVETLVSPPEVVAEEFVRGAVARRYDRAAEKLDEQGKLSEDDVRTLAHEIEGRTGDTWHLDAERQFLQGDSAQALARVRGDVGEAHVRVTLTRSHGEWKVTMWAVY